MGNHEADVRAAWRGFAGDSAAARAVLEAVLERHREPHRHYHTVRHIAWVIRHVATLTATEPHADAGAIVAAACFHDAVYVPGAADNEDASAQLAARELRALGWDDARVGHVCEMVAATADHDSGGDPDTMVLVDADLAVLGAEPSAYAAYVTGVRAEYAHVDDVSWRTGRGAVLEGFLRHEHIYATPTGRDLFESHARANLAAELASLRT